MRVALSFTAMSLGACAMFAASAARADPTESPRLRLGAGLSVGVASHVTSRTGPWLEGFLAVDVRLTGRLRLRLEPGLAWTSNSIDNSYDNRLGGDVVPYVENLTVVAGMLRASLGLDLAEWVSLRGGLSAGWSAVSLDASYCAGSTSNGLAGAMLGAALRLGAQQRFEVGAQAELTFLPTPGCTTGVGGGGELREPAGLKPFVIGSVRATWLFL